MRKCKSQMLYDVLEQGIMGVPLALNKAVVQKQTQCPEEECSNKHCSRSNKLPTECIR